jgi:hypothetical protein
VTSSQIVVGANSGLGGTSTATCPADKILLGGGAEIVSGGGSVNVTKPSVAGVGGSWTAQGSLVTTVVRAYAVCTT